MKVRQLTIPGDDLLRIRVISWDEGEVSRIQSHRTAVPDLYWDDTPERKLLRRYRIKQVMDDGTESPWVITKRISFKAGFNQNVRIRIKPVSTRGRDGFWQYASVVTGATPSDPGGSIIESFLNRIYDLLISDYIDLVHLEIERHDSAYVPPRDDSRKVDVNLAYLETIPLNRLTEILHIAKELATVRFVENAGIALKVIFDPTLELIAEPDSWSSKPVADIPDGLLSALFVESWDSALREAIQAALDDSTLAATIDSYELVTKHLVETWVNYLATDSYATRITDFTSMVASWLLAEEVPLHIVEAVAATELLSRLTVTEDVVLANNAINSLEFRTTLRDSLILPIVSGLVEAETETELVDRFHAVQSYLQATTDDGSGWLVDVFDGETKEKLEMVVSAIFEDVFPTRPQGEPYIVHLWEFIESLAALLKLRVTLRELRLLSQQTHITESPNLKPSFKVEQVPYFHLSSIAHVLGHSDIITYLELILDAALDKVVLRNNDGDINVVLGPEYGAEISRFIMGQFILGVTPMGIVYK